MLIVFTGDGKGKTTAALGQALRAVGDKKKVLMVQLIKGPWKSGEDASHKKLLPYFKIVKKGEGFVGIGHDSLPFGVHVTAAVEGLGYAKEQAETGRWDILIVDEIWNAWKLGLLTEEEISEFIDVSLPHVLHLILTGRNCPEQFIKRADLVTEMKEVKHPFAKGVSGKQGLEY
ncbi:MAG: hypothetical protein A3C06_04305 [Candidatus Taylorbacteria bacterium RIFCSPHIGHO2_02_FULL_46_13]|uniref:Cob(I)yrinic acid a,c-diamide adenosyltransferase n=1 Tax=Candidatus Taylorbacteria bacterium RIFCSPHIGHO2_02_FULL_46_13 TaxID=1802312 RepID=A0A1G2MT78_9BACT|nr:MAG: hypothetical protein A3C06_04305 [Candidatus Taylorbacteria bacterium RIFCSPHIGHO2_02_FULL_46_13]